MPEAAVGRAATARAALIASLDVLRGGADERFDRITRATKEALDVPFCLLNVVDQHETRTVSPVNPDGTRAAWPLSETFCPTTIESDRALVVPDASVDGRFADLACVRNDEQHVRFYAGVPIATPGGTRIGTLCVMDTEPRDMSCADVRLLGELATWAERVLADGRRIDDLSAVIRASRPRPLDLQGWTLAARSIAGHELEGGFHDWSEDADGVTVTVADVLGDGHGAGILAASIRSALRARSSESAAEAVAGAEAQVGPEFEAANSHVALFHARLDPRSGRLDWVDAGLGVTVVMRADGSHELLRSRDLPIGLHPTEIPRDSGAVVLEPGDVVLVATAGLLRLHDDTLDTLVMAGRRLASVERPDDFFAQVDAQAARRQVLEGITAVVLARAA
jgi:hypothetical protein